MMMNKAEKNGAEEVRRALCKLIAFAMLLSWLPAAGALAQQGEPPYPYTLTDDIGKEVTLESHPSKVAVLTSSLADLWQIAGGDICITVGETVDRKLVDDNVLLVDQGAGKNINMESLLAAEPDFVLYSTELAGQRNCVSILEQAGIPAVGCALDDFDDFLRLLKCFTEMLGTPERYQQYGHEIELEIERIVASAREHEYSPTYLFVRAGSTANVTKAKTARNHFVCRMLDDIGAVNIAEATPILLNELSMEAVLMADPNYILYSVMGSDDVAGSYMDSLRQEPIWQSLSAVRTYRVHYLSKELFQYKPNARWAEAYRVLVNLLYGDT